MNRNLSLLCAALATGACFQVQAADFPELLNTHTEADPANNGRPPVSAAEAAAQMTLPPGFKVSVFASEPDVHNALAMNWDTQGRLWVVENYTMERDSFSPDFHDRILIFEGGDGQGRFTSRKVFTDQLQNVMGVAVGYGGVWVIANPTLLFIPDRNADGVPDGPPQVVLDGFRPTGGNKHTSVNGVQFGIDGWLYGRIGHSYRDQVAPPGTPANERFMMQGAIWRYHPIKKIYEWVSNGVVNPWGQDWDKYGEHFFDTTIVAGSLWYAIPGAHYHSSSADINPKAYEVMITMSDHSNREVGGGHAAVGFFIYQGDNWPAEYRDRFYNLNLFGHQMNVTTVERNGSGFIAHRVGDILQMPDPWYRGIDLKYGPDGGVFISDWTDTGDYHNRGGENRNSGRIYKITYGDAKPSGIGNLRNMNVAQLVALNTHANEHWRRFARQELIDRSVDGRGIGNAKELLRAQFDSQSNIPLKLRSLWTLWSIGGADDAFLQALLRSPDEHLRVWGIRLLTEFWPKDDIQSNRPSVAVAGGPDVVPSPALMAELNRMAAQDSSSLVRLVLSSTLQRLPVNLRTSLAAGLVTHKEDATDPNIPLMVWYGLIPVANTQPETLAALAGKTELRSTRKYIARRLAEDMDTKPGPINDILATAITKDEAFQSDIVDGITQALNGVAKANTPPAWDAFAKKVGGTAVLVEPAAPAAAPAPARGGGRGGGARGGGARGAAPAETGAPPAGN